MMELLSPAGSLEKLRIAYRYGADAAYIGIKGYSLRSAADTIVPSDSEIEERAATLSLLKRLGGRTRKLYGALNLFAHERDLDELPRVLNTIQHLPLDALIVADIGLIEPIRDVLPEIELHLSTQANCTNRNAAKLYHRLGFSRIVAARELTLSEIAAIRDAVPELEVEVFVHGAMCMSYSGRCFLSTTMTGRSANRGDCAHSCRWNYAITEEKRPGEYYPIEEDGRFSTILSSRDLMLYDRVAELRSAGVTAIKIEGRMKSALYAAVTAGAYRAAIDGATERYNELQNAASCGPDRGDPLANNGPNRSPDPWRKLLFSLSHREYTQGFLFNDESVHHPSAGFGPASFRLMGVLRHQDPLGSDRWTVEAKNAIYPDAGVSLLTPDGTLYNEPEIELFDANGAPTDRIIHGRGGALRVPAAPSADLEDGLLVLPSHPRDSRR